MFKGKLLLLATLAVLLSLGMTPIAKADVEIFIQPEVTYTHPGDSVFFTVGIVNHDSIGYRCCLSSELWLPNGRVVQFPDRYFPLRPLQSITRHIFHTIPWNAPLGEYTLVLELYDMATGDLLDDARARIIVEEY